MANYEGRNMRGMMRADYSDIRMDKSRELNDNMSIDIRKEEDSYGKTVHTLRTSTDRDTNLDDE